jgi:starch-binding outer membrane protein, SusD/RagB family
MNIKNILINKTTKFAFIYKMLLIFSLAFVSSCSEDILDREPLDKYSDASVWKDPALTDAFISNVYKVFPTGWNILGNLCDENNRRNNVGYAAINAGNLTPSTTSFVNYWSRTDPSGGGGYRSSGYYDVVKRCNIFFEKIDDSPFDETTKDRMIGEMKFFRAYAYFRLATMYNGVPLITKTFELTDDFFLPRNTYDECMDFVLEEYEEAIPLLPLTYEAANIGRITKGTVMAAKARALLYMASPLNNPLDDQTKWQKAADAAKAIIDLNIYALYPDYRDSYLAVALYNSEIIWNRLYNNSLFLESRIEQSHFPNGYFGYAHTHPLQNIVDDYEMLSGILPKDDPTYDPQNPYVNRDPRFYECILYDGAMFQGREVESFLPGGQDSPEGTIYAWNSTNTSYYIRKFVDESIIVPSGNNMGDTPWPHFRYNEVLLNYAEASYYLGNETTCRDYVNMIRSRPSVDMPLVTESGTALLERYRHERRIELYFEEHRWFDVRRWKIAPEVLSLPARKVDIVKDLVTGKKTYTYSDLLLFGQTRYFPEKMYYLPIPQTEMNKNPNLVQNPGY